MITSKSEFMGDTTVTSNRSLSSSYNLLTLQLPRTDGWEDAVFTPGCFAEVATPAPGVLLRRPSSVSAWDKASGTIELLVQAVGKGSRYLAELQQGQPLNIIAPLGHGFTTDPKQVGDKPLLIAGGVGVAPIRFLANTLAELGLRPYILQGARTKDLLVLREELNGAGTLLLTTDDGSEGERGTVLDHSILKEETFSSVFVCGPHPMMKAVAQHFTSFSSLPVEVSLENKMACGIGACLCCVTNTIEGKNVRVCTQGPVFDARTISW